jgi:hypothetical protein
MPAQHQTVSGFLDALDSDRRSQVDALRELVLSAHPGLVETIKWNSPSYSLYGVDRLTVNVSKTGPVRLILHHGTRVAEDKGEMPSFTGDPAGLLTWHSNIRASLNWTTADAADAADAADGNSADILAVLRSWLPYEA